MEKRKMNVSFYKAGNGTGARVNFSVPNLKKLGVTPEDKAIIITYEDDKITITKDTEKE